VPGCHWKVIYATARPGRHIGRAAENQMQGGLRALVPESVLALTQVPAGLVESVQLEDRGFRFTSLTDPFDVRLLPGAVKYGDLPAMVQRIKAPVVGW
jgi:hypothetical protein